jgi:hypothetical protein
LREKRGQISIDNNLIASLSFIQLNRNRKLLLSAVGLFTFDWNKEKICLDDSTQEFFNEFERIECLKHQAGLVADSKDCKESINRKAAEGFKVNDMDSWEFYVQNNNMITWRREEEEGHYAYKGEKRSGNSLRRLNVPSF